MIAEEEVFLAPGEPFGEVVPEDGGKNIAEFKPSKIVGKSSREATMALPAVVGGICSISLAVVCVVRKISGRTIEV